MAVPQIKPGETKVGWIGTGVMGSSMAGHLLKAGFPLTAYSRTKSKAEPLLAQGAKWADSPRAVAAASDVIFAIVGFPSDVREVLLGTDGALAGSKAGQRPGRHDDQRTIAGGRNRASCQSKGVFSVDAPVSGGTWEQKTPRSRSWSAGIKTVVEALQPVFSTRWAKRSSTRGRGSRSAHQNGQPNPDRHEHDRRL